MEARTPRSWMMAVGLVLTLGGGLNAGFFPAAQAEGGKAPPVGSPPRGEREVAVEVGALAGTVSVGYTGGGYGALGVGFSLDAGGSLSRCHSTLGQDGENAPLTWSAADRFCYGGARLVLESGTYGSDKAQYRPQTSPLVWLKQPCNRAKTQ